MGQLQREVHLGEPQWKEAWRRDRAREVKDRVIEVKGKPGREGEEGEKTEAVGRKEKFCKPMSETSDCVWDHFFFLREN